MSYTKQCQRAQWLRLRTGTVGINWRLSQRFDLSPRSAIRVVASQAPCRRCARLAWFVSQPRPVTPADVGRGLGVTTRTARRWLRSWESECVATDAGGLWSVLGSPSLCTPQEAPCPPTY